MLKKLLAILMLCCVSTLFSMDLPLPKKQRLTPPSQNILYTALLDAFFKQNYTAVEDLLSHFSENEVDINLPLTDDRWKGRIIFNIFHNEYVRRNSDYYKLRDPEQCRTEFVKLYTTFCDIFKNQININIKDTDPSHYRCYLGEPWDVRYSENGSTPLMYIIDRILECEECIKSIKNIFIEFLQRFGTKDIDYTVTNRDGKTIFDMCTLQPDDSENIREKKEYIYGMLTIMTRKIFIEKTGLHKLNNCHFRFITQ